MPKIVRTQEEIDKVLNFASGGEIEGSTFPGMSYEQGILAMYRWLTGESDDCPDDSE